MVILMSRIKEKYIFLKSIYASLYIMATWDTEAEGWQVQGLPKLQNKFKDSLGNLVSFCFKRAWNILPRICKAQVSILSNTHTHTHTHSLSLSLSLSIHQQSCQDKALLMSPVGCGK
jgi:hypothetical protein